MSGPLRRAEQAVNDVKVTLSVGVMIASVALLISVVALTVATRR